MTIEIKNRNKFVLEIPGIYSFAVKSILQKPVYKKRTFNFLNKKTLKTEGDLIVECHSFVSPSIIQQAYVLALEGKSFDIMEKGLDPPGSIISLIHYKNCSLKEFQISSSDYSSNECEFLTLKFKVKEMLLEF